MKRLLLAISLLFCLIALAAAGVYSLREQLLGPPLLAALNAQLAPTLGVELTVERIGGNYYNRLELHNIRSYPLPSPGAGPSLTTPSPTPSTSPSSSPSISPSPSPSPSSSPSPSPSPSPSIDEARLQLNLASIKLDYSLAALRHGLAPFLDTLQIHLADGDLALNLNAPPPPTAAASVQSGAPAEMGTDLFFADQTDESTGKAEAAKNRSVPISSTLALLPSISGQGLNFTLLYHELHLSGQDIQFTLQQESRSPSPSVYPSTLASPATPVVTLTLQSPLVGLEHPQLVPLQAPLQLKLRSDGQSATLESLRLGEPLGEPRGEQLGELLRVETARLEYGAESGESAWHLTLALQALGGKFHLDASVGPDSASPIRPSELTITDIDLAQLAALTTAIPDRLAPIEGLLDLKALVELPPQPFSLTDPTAATNSTDPIASTDLVGSLTLHLRQAALAGHTLDDLELAASLEQGLLHLEQLAARLGDNHLNVQGLALNLADLRADNLNHLPTKIKIKQFNGDFTDLPALWTLAGRPTPSAPELIPTHRLTFTGALQDGILQLDRAKLDAGPAGHLGLKEATFGPRPESGDYQELPIAGALQLQIADLKQVSALLGLPPLTGSLKAALEFTGTPNAPGGRGEIMATNLLWQELTFDQVHGEVELSPQRLKITELNVQSGADGLKAQGTLALPPAHLLRQTAMATWFSQMHGEDFQIKLTLNDMARYRKLLPASWQQHQLGGGLGMALSGSGGLDDHRIDGSLKITHGQWQELELGELTATVSSNTHGGNNHINGLVQLKRGRWKKLELGGLESDFKLDLGPDESPNKTPSNTINKSITKAQILLRAEDLSAPKLTLALLNAEIGGGGNLESLQLQGSLELHDGHWGKYSGRKLTAGLTWQDQRLLISDATLESPLGQAWLSAEIGGLGSREIKIKLSDLRLQNEDMEVALLEPAQLALIDGRLTLAELKLGGPTANLTLSGGYQPQPSGSESDPELDLQGTLRSKNLAWLAPFINGVRRIEGAMESEFHLSGTVTNPQISGNLTLNGGGLRFFGDTPPLNQLAIKAQFQGNRLQFQHFTGVLGGAPFNVSGGITYAPYRPWDLEQLELDLTLSGRDILFYRNEGVRVRGEGKLNFNGPLSGVLVSGEVLITDGLYSKKIDFLDFFRGSGSSGRQTRLELFSFNSPPLRDLRFQIRLRTATSFLVANNLARGSLRPVLTLGGSGELPVLTGEIYLDPIRISLPSGRLNVEGGVIRFPESDPDRPTFDLTAGARLAGYDIHLLLQGSADDPVLTLSSVPPLADDQLLLLLLTGQPPTLSGSAGQRQAGMNLAVYLGRDLLGRLLSGQETESDEGIMERFELEIGRGISRSGQETLEASFLLAEDLLFDNEQILITSERDIYDDFNIGLKIIFSRP